MKSNFKSPNYDDRRLPINMLILHYTESRDAKSALTWLCDPEPKNGKRVSAHYVVDKDGTCYQLVADEDRAWHAGVSFWAGETDINSCSLGIEIVNGGHKYGLPNFPEAQMVAVEKLCLSLVEKYSIPKARVLGHSDVAPARKEKESGKYEECKKDPGEKFDWARLAKAGIGLWNDPQPEDSNYIDDASSALPKLKEFGYDPNMPVELLLKAFQRHYRPMRVDGRLDGSTSASLDALLEERLK